MSHTGDASWRCSNDISKFCPPEGCPQKARNAGGEWFDYGCARDHGWLPGRPSPAECQGLIPAAAREADLRAEVERLKEDRAAIIVGRDMLGNFWAKEKEEAGRLRALLDEAREELRGWLNIAAHCDITDGSCYCGEDMRNHSPAMDCGHVAVDHGGYVTNQRIKTTEATLAKIGDQK